MNDPTHLIEDKVKSLESKLESCSFLDGCGECNIEYYEVAAQIKILN